MEIETANISKVILKRIDPKIRPKRLGKEDEEDPIIATDGQPLEITSSAQPAVSTVLDEGMNTEKGAADSTLSN